jgi:hypothetical protein
VPPGLVLTLLSQNIRLEQAYSKTQCLPSSTCTTMCVCVCVCLFDCVCVCERESVCVLFVGTQFSNLYTVCVCVRARAHQHTRAHACLCLCLCVRVFPMSPRICLPVLTCLAACGVPDIPSLSHVRLLLILQLLKIMNTRCSGVPDIAPRPHALLLLIFD